MATLLWQLQDDLLTLIVRFKCYRFTFTADAETTSKQMPVHSEDYYHHLIVWHKNLDLVCNGKLNLSNKEKLNSVLLHGLRFDINSDTPPHNDKNVNFSILHLNV